MNTCGWRWHDRVSEIVVGLVSSVQAVKHMWLVIAYQISETIAVLALFCRGCQAHVAGACMSKPEYHWQDG